MNSTFRIVPRLVARLVWFLLVLEVGAYAAFWVLSGERPGHPTARESQRAIATMELWGQGTGADGRRRGAPDRRQVRHPYLGFVGRPARNSRQPGISALAGLDLADPDAPFYDEETFVVGITGGSVAAQVANYGGELILERLAQSSRLAGRRVHLFGWAGAGYKQPQQLAGLAYLISVGVRFDAVLNLDGFNEIALAQDEVHRFGVFPAYPRVWPVRVFLAETAAALAGELAYRDQRRVDGAREVLESSLRWSWVRQLAWLVRDRREARERHESLARLQEQVRIDDPREGFERFGPRLPEPPERDLAGELVAIWERSSRAMAALCAGEDAVYLHALQPNQYDQEFDKPMAAAERRLALHPEGPYAEAARTGYPRLREGASRLARDGIDVLDLKGLFADVEDERLADDCCHFNRVGNIAIAEALVDELLARLP